MKAIGVRAEQTGRTHGRYRPILYDNAKEFLPTRCRPHMRVWLSSSRVSSAARGRTTFTQTWLGRSNLTQFGRDKAHRTGVQRH